MVIGAAARSEPPAPGAAALARAYGSGVHSYFARDYQRAYDDLSQAIEAGSEDPRAWYFRGLAAGKLGRLDEAEADFSTAALKESQALADWRVSRSLERVQGQDRLQLERHRMRARMASLQRRIQADERRYIDNQMQQPEVRRRVRPEGAVPDALGMFTDEAVPADGEAVDAPVEALPKPAEDGVEMPAADGAASEPPLGEASAFDEPAAVAEEPMAEEPGGEQPAADEPFGDAPAADEPMAEEPVAEEPVAEEPAAEEPVAEEPVAEEPAAEEPAAEEPAAEEPMVEGQEPPPADAPSTELFGD